jgi:SAM-dependent methyltransferase
MDKILHHGQYYSEEQMREIVIAYYNDVFSNQQGRHYQMQQLFPNNLNVDSKILDYGCGMGGVSKLFLDRYQCEIDAVEISENELKKAMATFGESDINFMLLDKFSFPKSHYDLIFSSQVIEHVHNPGNYLSKINSMLKEDGFLLIGLPNIINAHTFIEMFRLSEKRAIQHSKKIFKEYHKAIHHINSWEPTHFITLLASCGFEVVKYLPTEGTPLSFHLKKIPIIGKYLYKLPIQTPFSYTMFFLVQKKKYVAIGDSD